MSIRQLPSGKWNAQLRVTGHPTKSKTFASNDKAKAWLVSEKQKHADQRPFHTLSDLGEQYAKIGLVNKSTQYETIQRLGRLVTLFQTFNIPIVVKDLTSAHINEFRIYRLSLVASATVRKDLLLVNRIFKWAAKHYMLELPNPVEGVSLPADSKPRTRIVEREELDQLVAKLKPCMAAIVELAYETAMRRAEICKLQPKNLKLDERFLSVIDGKTGDRLVPLTKRAVEILKEASEGCLTDESRIFPVEPHSVTTAFRRARKQVGLDDDVRLHQLRHTRITAVARKGFNQAQIMMVSGHIDTRSVQRYTHLNVNDVIELID